MRRLSLRHDAFVGLVGLLLLLGGFGRAQAGFVQLAAASDLNPADTTATYTGSDGDIEASPYVLTAGTNTLTFTTADGGNFFRANQGDSWTPGAFPNGEALLVSVDPNTGVGSAVTITFTDPVTQVGLYVQQNVPVNTTFTATVNGTAPSLTAMVTVPDSGGNGNLGFIGFAATGSDTISSIVISSSDGNSADASQFAMGPLIGPFTSIPEPSTLSLGYISILGLIAYRFLRRMRAAV
jgi:hypothetical protein